MPVNSNNLEKDVASPCIRNCCLNHDDICVGCYRHLDEIVGWQSRNNDEKASILELCAKRKVELYKPY